MSSVPIPALCSSCGTLFASRVLRIQNGVKNTTLLGNKETCPKCGKLANIADGIFDVANNILSIVTAPNITREMLEALGGVVKKAYEQKKSSEELENEIKKIDPSFGGIIQKFGANKPILSFVFVVILILAKSCHFNADYKLDMKLDVNELLNQVIQYYSK